MYSQPVRKQYFRTSYLKRVFWSLRSFPLVTYVQDWTRVGTAATSHFPVNILYVSIMSHLIRLKYDNDNNDNKDIYNAQIRRGSKCSVVFHYTEGAKMMANSLLLFSVPFPMLLYPLFYTAPNQNSSSPSVSEPCFCTIIWKWARLNV